MKSSILFLIFSIFLLQNVAARSIFEYLTPKPQHIEIDSIETNFTKEKIINLNSCISELNNSFFNNNYKTLPCSDIISFEISTNFDSQHYKIEIKQNSIEITGGDEAALFYAKQTLIQIFDYIIYENAELMCMTVEDYPNFQRRAYMLDISRDKVPTMQTLFSIIDKLASWKINELQLYTEHTFAYKNHKTVWENASPITAEEIHQLEEYCKQKYIELIPNQNSFGHFENWLKHDEYLPLADCPDDCATKWGKRKRSSLNPCNPQSLELMKELYSELLPNFTSKYFNIGCDETIELGKGLSKQLCDSLGVGQIYLNYLCQLNTEVNKLGKFSQFWGDIILNHSELIHEIPCNMTAMVWGYDKDYDFDKNLTNFELSGLDFYVCPGTSTWRSLIGRNPIAFENMKNAAIYGQKHHAKGFMLTDWGDYGHWQPLSVSYPAILTGASFAWNYDSTNIQNLEFQLNHYVFLDKNETTAKAILRLGEAYTKAEIPDGVANAFHLMLHRYPWTIKGNYQTRELKIENLEKSEIEIISALDILKKSSPQCSDSLIIKKEIELAAELAIHGIHLGIARLNAKNGDTKNIAIEIRDSLSTELEPLIKKHKELWTLRNRIGGLNDSSQKLQNLLDYYKDENQESN